MVSPAPSQRSNPVELHSSRLSLVHPFALISLSSRSLASDMSHLSPLSPFPSPTSTVPLLVSWLTHAHMEDEGDLILEIKLSLRPSSPLLGRLRPCLRR